MKKETSDLTAAQVAELAVLAALPDDRINTRDIPEQKDWSGAKRGVFFRPINVVTDSGVPRPAPRGKR